MRSGRKTQPAPASAGFLVPADAAEPAEGVAGRLATLTVHERDLWAWGLQQEPAMFSRLRAAADPSIAADRFIDSCLALFAIQQHIQQCLGAAHPVAPPATCTHIGAGAPFPSRLNALLAPSSAPGGGRWTADSLAVAITAEGVPVSAGVVAAFSRGERYLADRLLVAAVARALGVPMTYFAGRAVRMAFDTAAGADVVVEQLRNAVGEPNRCPITAFSSLK